MKRYTAIKVAAGALISLTVAPDLEFRAWTGVSHFLMIEKPKEFNAAVASFIAKRKLL